MTRNKCEKKLVIFAVANGYTSPIAVSKAPNICMRLLALCTNTCRDLAKNVLAVYAKTRFMNFVSKCPGGLDRYAKPAAWIP